MTNLKIEKTATTPEVDLRPDGILKFSGKSYPEDILGFYDPIFAWLNEYFDGNEQKDTIVDLNISYFNSGSSKMIFDILDIFNNNTDKSNITVNWHYHKEDDSSKEDGEDFQDSFDNLKMNLVPIQ